MYVQSFHVSIEEKKISFRITNFCGPHLCHVKYNHIVVFASQSYF